jgi:hypothetical protein
MSPRRGVLSYVAAAQAALVAGGFAITGKPAQGAVFALGAVFLIYWGRRQDRERGER